VAFNLDAEIGLPVAKKTPNFRREDTKKEREKNNSFLVAAGRSQPWSQGEKGRGRITIRKKEEDEKGKKKIGQ